MGIYDTSIFIDYETEELLRKYQRQFYRKTGVYKEYSDIIKSVLKVYALENPDVIGKKPSDFKPMIPRYMITLEFDNLTDAYKYVLDITSNGWKWNIINDTYIKEGLNAD